MSFFKGQEIFSIDNKGRVNVPAKMRRALSPEANDTFVLTRGAERCIAAYPLNTWKLHEERFAALDQSDPNSRYLLRTLLSWCEESEIDAQQRISLSKRYVDFAGIEGKVLVVGMIDHIEFWNPDEFDRYMNSHDQTFEQVTALVMKPH